MFGFRTQAPPPPATIHERFFAPGVLAATSDAYHAAYVSCLHRMAPAVTAPVAVYICPANIAAWLGVGEAEAARADLARRAVGVEPRDVAMIPLAEWQVGQ